MRFCLGKDFLPELTEEQLKQIEPVAEQWGNENSVGTVDKFELKNSFLAGVCWRESDVQNLIFILRHIAMSIDWNQQSSSQYYIGEDAAESILMKLGYPCENGLNNDEVRKFIDAAAQQIQEKPDGKL